MGLKVNPYHGLIIGVFLYLISLSSSSRVVNERVVVPAYGYVEWPVQVYPGQAVRAMANVPTDDGEIIYGVLELLIMDEKSFAHYESDDHGNIGERTNEWLSSNWLDDIDFNVWWFGRVHVVLSNENAIERDASKVSKITIDILRPYGYLTFPSLVLVGVSLAKSYKQFKKDFM